MFGKRRKRIVPDNISNVCEDFVTRLPCRSHPFAEYKLLDEFQSYTGYIDSCLEKLFSVRVDSGNGDTLKNDIYDMTGQALADLDRQQVAHTSGIYALYNSRTADITALQSRLEELAPELRTAQGELDEARERYRQSRFRRNGGGRNV